MPAKSQQQQKFMGLVHAYKKGEVPASKVSSAIKQAAKSMSKKSVKKYAQTDHDDLPKKVSEEKKNSNNLAVEFGKSYQKFTVAVNGLAKSMINITGDKTDAKIIMKAFKKHIIPFVRLVDSWNSGQQKNPNIDEKVIKVSKKDDVPGNAMKMSGEEKIKKLTYSGSNGKGSYEIKGKNLNVNGIRPRDKGFFVRHFTMKTGFRKANLYYDGVSWMDKNKKF